MVIVNGVPDSREYNDSFDPPDRVIKLNGITIEFSRTSDGGLKQDHLSYESPSGGGGGGAIKLENLIRTEGWIAEKLWRRIVDLEDEIRVLRIAIGYKE